ncbi:MAG TPA: TonB-dependent receptor [Pyrinomonadaceae bacterium]|jgi:iron complex outermembrane receptor protein|nr:TonB-dependent receptor [Pyrinomonadaceae bacterium]
MIKQNIREQNCDRRQLPHRRCLSRAITLGALLLLLSIVSVGQSTTAIKGSVTDENGGKIGAADVRLRSRTGVQLSTATDNNGAFEFQNLPPSQYLIEVQAAGFATFASNEILIARGQTKQLDVTLKVAGVNESIVVTAAGTAQREDEVSKVVSTIDSKQIDEKRELALWESLRGTPGVRVQQQGSPGTVTSIRLRGQRQFDTAVLLDGLRVRDASDIGGSAASLTSDLVTVATDRVEILRGSGSSIYGTNAIGGVVNIVPETPTSGLHFEVGAEGGGLRTFRERVKVSGGNGHAGLSLGLSRLDVRRGVDGEDQYGNSAGTGRFLFAPSSSITIAVNLYGTIANARLNDSPFALPGAFSGSQPFPRAVAGVSFHPDFNNPDEGRRNRLLVGSVKLSHQLNERVSYSVAYQRVPSHRRNYNGSRIDPQFAAFYPFGDFEFVSVNKGTTDTIDARLNLQPVRSNLATIGFEYENESLFQQALPSFSAFNNTTDRQRTFAVFGQDQISLLDDRLQLSLGIRGQFYRIRAADRPGVLSGVNAEKSITGDGAIAYFIRSTNTKLRAHVGNGFRAVSLFERFGAGTFSGLGLQRFGDPTLRAEQSISVDAGFDQRLARDRVLMGVTYFYTRHQRLIDFESFFVVDPLGLGRFSGYVNRPGGIARGVEAFLETTPWRGGEIRASYTYTNSDRQVPFRGLQPQYVTPSHAFGLVLNQRYRSFAVNFDLNYTGSHIAPVFENDFPFRTAELTFDGYTKGDLFGSYERRLSETSTMVIFAGAENIFAQRYYENGFLAPGIVGRGGVKFKF